MTAAVVQCLLAVMLLQPGEGLAPQTETPQARQPGEEETHRQDNAAVDQDTPSEVVGPALSMS